VLRQSLASGAAERVCCLDSDLFSLTCYRVLSVSYARFLFFDRTRNGEMQTVYYHSKGDKINATSLAPTDGVNAPYSVVHRLHRLHTNSSTMHWRLTCA
jgi:hypothetical protein